MSRVRASGAARAASTTASGAGRAIAAGTAGRSCAGDELVRPRLIAQA